MTLKADVFREYRSAKIVITQISKRSRFRELFERQQG